jgi:predicted DNA-binding protein
MATTKRTALKIPVELNDELSRIAKQENRTKIGLLRWFVEQFNKNLETLTIKKDK